MDLYNVILLADTDNAQIIVGLLAILSMVVARLLDWYFPSKHHRKLDEEIEKHKEEDDNE